MDAVALSFGVFPLSDVGVSVSAPPYAAAMLEPVGPLAVIYFTVRPGVDTLSIGLA